MMNWSYIFITLQLHSNLFCMYITLSLFHLQAKMGYKEGMGLGKAQQGRTEIVEASNQRGRRGLGLRIKGLEPSREVDWNFELEEVKVVYWGETNEPLVTSSLIVRPFDFELYWFTKLKFYFQIIEKEEISWIPKCGEPVPSIEIMRNWKVVGKVWESPDASFTHLYIHLLIRPCIYSSVHTFTLPYITSEVVYINDKMSLFSRKS